MRITLLGTGTGIPRPDRASPGFVIEFQNIPVLVDPGSGSLNRMTRSGLDAYKVTHVLLTHFHPDHTGDLVPLLFAMNLPEYFPAGRLTLIGPPGLKDFYAGLTRVFGNSVRLDPDRLSLVEISDETLGLENWKVEAVPVDHTENSQGYRFSEEDRVFVYSGDTGYCSNLVRLLRGADVALVECSHPSDAETSGHLTPALAGRAALEAEVKRLLLTHIYPDCDGRDIMAELRESGYDRPAAVAADGMKLEV